jgi:ribose/xylose/arabinose/galactoside ABC-type transport system permease subunit
LQSENKRTGDSVLGKLRILVNVQQWGIIIVLVILVLVLGVSSPVFLSGRNIRNILQQVSTLGILSMGMTILMISGGIDLSVGSSISVVAVIVGKLLKAGVPVGIPIVLGLLIGCFIGLINGLLASQTRAHPFILTLGTMTLFQGVAIIITEGYPITDLGDKFEWIGGATVGKIPFIVILFFAVMIACFFILKYTRLGRKAYAIGGNEYTTYLAGIRVKIFKTIYYVTCGFLTGLAALVLSSRISSAIPTMGTGFELQSIAAVVIGGTPLTGGRGSVWGTLTGVLLLGIIANGLNLLHVEASWQYVMTGAVIIIAVILHEHRSR